MTLLGVISVLMGVGFNVIIFFQQREIRELQAEHDRLCKVLSGVQAHD